MQMEQSEKQQKRDERFKSSLFQEPQMTNSQSNQPQKLSNQNYIQIFIKCIISPDVVVEKNLMNKQNGDQDDEIEIILDEVIENQQLGMKKEFNVFVEREQMKEIKLLQQNYIESQDLIKMPVCGTNGIRLPEEHDFQLYFKFLKSKAEHKQLLVQESDLKAQFGLLICGSIFNDEQAQDAAFKEITKKATIEIIFKLLLVTAQYESWKYTIIVYKLVRCLFFHQANLLEEVTDPILIMALAAKNNISFEVVRPNFIKLKMKEHIITINTTFLYPIHKKYEAEKNEYLKPLEAYQYFQVIRNADIFVRKRLSRYTWLVYRLIRMEKYSSINTSQFIVFQNISKKKQDKYSRFNENYVGTIKRNLMGTTFKIYDDGYSKKHSHLFPDWVGSERRNLLNIEYETNIMASQPRKFDISFYSFETKNFEQLITLAPKYNQEKDCYQLHFYGRAKIPSARNFQMIRPGDDATVFLLHGKVDRNIFNVDFRPPINIMQAFCISMVSISSKMLVS